ncbi:CobW family GTP-binding protein [Leekyejoonella antrihumi]|uniref:CobW family GTP-binding protein n=1 Tax=Leekyejoonella antrihumi TaxID=1660198 RepID=UPI0016472D29|nr:GTP-binding protein [Leekyejoonella antrihumi]
MTVLGGYLGAGKTTLINRILARASGERIVVVVNDFGAVNIDAELIRSRDGNTLELANGCICCDLSGGMPAVMSQIAAMTPAPQQVLIEVSGVGDPGPVAAWGDHPGFRRGGVLVCADVETIQDRAHGKWVADTVMHQLHSADLLLLTKTDLVDAEQTDAVGAWLHTTVPGIPVLPLHGLDPAVLLDIAPGRPDTAAPEHHQPHPDHATALLTCADLVDREAFGARLDNLPEAVVRCKGVLRTTDSPDRRTIVHAVGRRQSWEDGGSWSSTDHASRIVLIAAPGSGEVLADVVREWAPTWSPTT